jgi:hypothetical protein
MKSKPQPQNKKPTLFRLPNDGGSNIFLFFWVPIFHQKNNGKKLRFDKDLYSFLESSEKEIKRVNDTHTKKKNMFNHKGKPCFYISLICF